jgi:DNA-binding LacI/PurR family transcriptional regulator
MTKRISLKDVAANAGVSYQTVSKVLNGQIHVLPETADRVWKAAHNLGYRPNHNARNLRSQQSRMIGYSWEPEKPNHANHILDTFLTSMVEEAEAAGYHLLPFPFRQGENLIDGYRELIDSGKVDGFVISSVNYHDPRAEYLLERQFPFVAFGRSNPELDFPYVDVDGTAGLQLANEYLISRGHRRIAVLAWPETSRVGNNRLEGYLAALKAAGLPIEPELISREEGIFANARTATEYWLSLPTDRRPTGVVALNDTMAIGAVQAGLGKGLAIGTELAVVGFDDSPMAEYLSPPLTTVRQPIREVGRKCVELLVARLKGKPLPEKRVLVKPELIVRASA